MGNFKRGGGEYGGRSNRRDGGGGFRDRNSRNSFGNRDRGPVTMHQATCDQCGNSCEVPFRPSGDKPVYCNDCFGGKKESGNDRGRDRFPQRSQSTARSDFRSDSGKQSNDGLVKQLEILNTKIDRLIGVIEAITSIKSPIEKKPVEAKKLVKKVTKE